MTALVAIAASPVVAQDREVQLGTTLPLVDRSMPSGTGEAVRLSDIRGERGTVLVFWSNDCPWVDKYEERLLESIARFRVEGYGFALVNSNDPVAFPEESDDSIRERANNRKYPVPYVRDEGSDLARALGATRTPHVFVFDVSDALAYSGTIDDSPGDPGNVGEAYLEGALESLVTGGRASVPRTAAFGCRIKYVE